MRNQLIATVKEVGPMAYEVTYEIKGDSMAWLKANKQSTTAMNLLDKAEYGSTHEFMYDSKIDKHVKSLMKLKNVTVNK